MGEISFGGYLLSFMMNTVTLAGIPLAVATGCGLLVAFFQAITQIQDQTLSQTVKITAIVIVLLSFGGLLVSPLLNTTIMLFAEFGDITR